MTSPLASLWLRAPALLFFPFLCFGCGSSESKKQPFPVSGSVFVSGKPAVRAWVTFHAKDDPDGKQVRPTGQVRDDGSFSLHTYEADDGAPAGDYAVTVQWFLGASPIGGDAESDTDKLGGRYANPRTTSLHAHVNEGGTQLPPFQLK